MITSKYLFPDCVIGSGPSISIATYSNGRSAGNSLRKRDCLRRLKLSFAQDEHCRIVLNTFIAIEGQ